MDHIVERWHVKKKMQRFTIHRRRFHGGERPQAEKLWVRCLQVVFYYGYVKERSQVK